MAKDVIINKVAIIERCISRIREEYANNPQNLQNYTKQDSIVLNIQRACEATIDLAMHVIAEQGWGVPQNSREAFDILLEKGIIDEKLSKNLKGMVGFRNLAVHDYQELNLAIVQQIIDKHLVDLLDYSTIMLNLKI